MQRGGENNSNSALNTSVNLYPENVEGLETVNLNTPEWNIKVGNSRNEKIPNSLQYRPNVPKMMLPPHLRTLSENMKGGVRRKTCRHSKKRSN